MSRHRQQPRKRYGGMKENDSFVANHVVHIAGNRPAVGE